MPNGLRIKLTSKIQSLQRHCEVETPQSEIEVVVYSDAGYYQAASWETIPGVTVSRGKLQSALPDFSIIATCYNEAANITSWLDSIALLTSPPKDVVLCDGGSTDGTVDIIRQWQCDNADIAFELKVVSGQRRNIAQGRNEAARHVQSEIILCSDVGTILHSEWAARIITPFATNQSLDCVFGWYEVQDDKCSSFAIQLQSLFVPILEEVNPALFLPSARSVAIKKKLYWQVGGYPEHLTRAGEDTLFDLSLKQAEASFVFAPEAIVLWQPPRNVRKTLAAIYSYSVGDGEAKTFCKHYIEQLNKIAAILLDFIIVVVLLILGSETAIMIAILLFAYTASKSLSLLEPYLKRIRARTGIVDIRQWFLALSFVAAQSLGFLRGITNR